MHTPVTLERVKVESYSELFELETAEVIKRLDEGREVPLHEGDAFLAILVLRGVADLADASRRLEDATKRLVMLTVARIAVAVVSLLIAA